MQSHTKLTTMNLLHIVRKTVGALGASGLWLHQAKFAWMHVEVIRGITGHSSRRAKTHLLESHVECLSHSTALGQAARGKEGFCQLILLDLPLFVFQMQLMECKQGYRCQIRFLGPPRGLPGAWGKPSRTLLVLAVPSYTKSSSGRRTTQTVFI